MSVQYDKANDMLMYKVRKRTGEGIWIRSSKSLNMPDNFIDMAYDIRIAKKSIYIN